MYIFVNRGFEINTGYIIHEELHLIEQGSYVNQDLCTLPESITYTMWKGLPCCLLIFFFVHIPYINICLIYNIHTVLLCHKVVYVYLFKPNFGKVLKIWENYGKSFKKYGRTIYWTFLYWIIQMNTGRKNGIKVRCLYGRCMQISSPA